MTTIREWFRRWLGEWAGVVVVVLLVLVFLGILLYAALGGSDEPEPPTPAPLSDADALTHLLDRCDSQPANLEPAMAAQLRQLCIVDVANEVFG